MTQALPDDFAAKLTKALRAIRVGDYGNAASILEALRRYLPTAPVDIATIHHAANYHRLRLGTLLAEVAEYMGRYEEARIVLEPYDRIVDELEELHSLGEHFEYPHAEHRHWLLLRQKLYFLWQRSVHLYRTGDIGQSRTLLNLAIELAERLRPRSAGLLTQLYYGAGKLAFHECNSDDAIKMYRKSLISATQRFEAARHIATAKTDVAFMRSELKATRYSVAKTLALGLAQCLREQGRLEEAHSQVVAGALLGMGDDTELSLYAQVLLSSIERSIAGEQWPEVLNSAALRIEECVRYFRDHQGDIGYRSRLELALCRMQQGRLDEARVMLEAMMEPKPSAKWIAECNLALSRVARRLKRHAEAVAYARESVNTAKAHSLESIKRRAHVVLILALYDQATENGVDTLLLQTTAKEIERAVEPKVDPNVRIRASLLLAEARVLNVLNNFTGGLEAYRKYKALAPMVGVGRINEQANVVEEELTANWPTRNVLRR